MHELTRASFDRDNNVAEIQAICAADYKFEPKEVRCAGRAV